MRGVALFAATVGPAQALDKSDSAFARGKTSLDARSTSTRKARKLFRVSGQRGNGISECSRALGWNQQTVFFVPDQLRNAAAICSYRRDTAAHCFHVGHTERLMPTCQDEDIGLQELGVYRLAADGSEQCYLVFKPQLADFRFQLATKSAAALVVFSRYFESDIKTAVIQELDSVHEVLMAFHDIEARTGENPKSCASCRRDISGGSVEIFGIDPHWLKKHCFRQIRADRLFQRTAQSLRDHGAETGMSPFETLSWPVI